MPQTRSSTMRQSRLTFAPIPSSSPIGTTENGATSIRTENFLTPSKVLHHTRSSASKLNSTLKISPVENMALPTPAPSSQIGQKDEESSDSTQTEPEILVSPRVFGRYARRGNSGSTTLPLTPQSRKKEPSSDTTFSVQATNLDETLKRKTDERKPPPRKLRRRLSSSVRTVSSSSNEDDVMPSIIRRKKQATSSARVTGSISNEGSSEDVISPKRRRHITRNMPDPPGSDSESDLSQNQVADDLQEDLDDLRDSNVCRHRTRGKMVNTERTNRQKKLEILKRRRDGKTIDLSSDSDSLVASKTKPSDDKRNIHQQPSQDEIIDTDHDSAVEAIRKSLRADAENDSWDNFLSDDDGFLGVDDLENIPFELTRHAHKKPFEHFKDAVEWMIHNKLNPAFPRTDVIYRIAFRKIDDEVRGYSSSKFVSSVWNRDFSQILTTLPELAVKTVQTMFDHKCDACNRSKHPAKHQLVFSGKPYNIDTLEDIEEEEDDHDDDDAKRTSGSTDTNQSRTFYLGSACAANAETAHGLIHWKYNLNYYVLKWLTDHGHTTSHKIIERESWSTKKRSNYANDVVDNMVKIGEMKVLYREFKENLDTARSVIPGRYSYGKR